MNRVASLANCYFADDSSGFPVLIRILRCEIMSFSSSNWSLPWPAFSDLAASA